MIRNPGVLEKGISKTRIMNCLAGSFLMLKIAPYKGSAEFNLYEVVINRM